MEKEKKVEKRRQKKEEKEEEERVLLSMEGNNKFFILCFALEPLLVFIKRTIYISRSKVFFFYLFNFDVYNHTLYCAAIFLFIMEISNQTIPCELIATQVSWLQGL